MGITANILNHGNISACPLWRTEHEKKEKKNREASGEC